MAGLDRRSGQANGKAFAIHDIEENRRSTQGAFIRCAEHKVLNRLEKGKKQGA